MDDFHLTTGQIASLKALHRLQRDRKKAYRINAIILLGTGWTVPQVADALLVDEKNVRIWHEKYVRGGEDELLTLFYVGKEPLPSETQQQELAEHLDENTYLDSKAVAHHIAKTYGVRYSRTSVKELLHRLDFVYKKNKACSCILGQCKLLHFPMVESQVEGIADCVTLFTGLFSEFELNRTIMEVFQEENTVQQVL